MGQQHVQRLSARVVERRVNRLRPAPARPGWRVQHVRPWLGCRGCRRSHGNDIVFSLGQKCGPETVTERSHLAPIVLTCR